MTNTGESVPCSEEIVTRYAGALAPPRPPVGGFGVEAFLAGTWRALIEPPVRYRRELEALAKKVEVGRRLYVAYDAEIKRAMTNEVAHPSYVALLCAIFLAVAEQGPAWRFLNTALKMTDGVLLEPSWAADAVLQTWI